MTFGFEKNGVCCTAAGHYLRQFHLWDLPQGQIFARLDDHYRGILIFRLFQRLGIVALTAQLNVDATKVRQWVAGGSDQLRGSRDGYLRLDVFRRVARIAGNGFSAKEVERHVTALTGYQRSPPATRMRLTFVSSMIRLVAHFIGDGSMYAVVESTRPSAYTNKDAYLRRGFITCLKRIFEDASECVREHTSDVDRAHVSVPKWIPYVIAHLYPDTLFGQMQARLPNAFFSFLVNCSRRRYEHSPTRTVQFRSSASDLFLVRAAFSKIPGDSSYK